MSYFIVYFIYENRWKSFSDIKHFEEQEENQ